MQVEEKYFNSMTKSLQDELIVHTWHGPGNGRGATQRPRGVASAGPCCCATREDQPLAALVFTLPFTPLGKNPPDPTAALLR
jgi:hypothetical protein